MVCFPREHHTFGSTPRAMPTAWTALGAKLLTKGRGAADRGEYRQAAELLRKG
jgi:hypothetical protein